MWQMPVDGWRARRIAAVICVVALAGCGGGGGVDVVVVTPPSPVAVLGISLTRVGPEAIQVDWSDDPYVDSFVVRRDGYSLVSVRSLTLVDASVLIGNSYCYDVAGYDVSGILIAASDTACVTVFP